MTDNEIIKALECCSKDAILNCRKCPYEESCNMGRSDMQKDALDLINRQKAEIERLQAMVDAAEEEFNPLPFKNKFDEYIEKCKAEIIKEFAKRVKERKYQSSDWSHGEHPFVVEESDIDEVLEEMTEDSHDHA